MEPFVFDEALGNLDVLDVFESFIWTDRYSEYGDFEVYTPATEAATSLLLPGRYLWIPDSEHLMIIEDRKIKADIETGDKLITTGRSLEAILTWKIVWNQTVLTGNLQDGIERLLRESIIAPADADRRMDNFIFERSTDPRITALTVNAQFTGDTIYDAIKHLCDPYEIGFKVVPNVQNQFVFSLYAGIDRSYEQTDVPFVIFSKHFENVISTDYSELTSTHRTVALVAGEGDGTARKTQIVTSAEGAGKGLYRRELYVDARDISSNNGAIGPTDYAAQLTQRGKTELTENGVTKEIDGQVDATRDFKYGEHFGMGDIVQVEHGIEHRSRVVEFTRSQSSSGLESYPTFKVI